MNFIYGVEIIVFAAFVIYVIINFNKISGSISRRNEVEMEEKYYLVFLRTDNESEILYLTRKEIEEKIKNKYYADYFIFSGELIKGINSKEIKWK